MIGCVSVRALAKLGLRVSASDKVCISARVLAKAAALLIESDMV
jgi:hypothetical protein